MSLPWVRNFNYRKKEKNYRNTTDRNTKLLITEVHKYELQKYQSTSYRNIEIQMTEIKKYKLQKYQNTGNKNT